jgi:hypothetical protein
MRPGAPQLRIVRNPAMNRLTRARSMATRRAFPREPVSSQSASRRCAVRHASASKTVRDRKARRPLASAMGVRARSRWYPRGRAQCPSSCCLLRCKRSELRKHPDVGLLSSLQRSPGRSPGLSLVSRMHQGRSKSRRIYAWGWLTVIDRRCRRTLAWSFLGFFDSIEGWAVNGGEHGGIDCRSRFDRGDLAGRDLRLTLHEQERSVDGSPAPRPWLAAGPIPGGRQDGWVTCHPARPAAMRRSAGCGLISKGSFPVARGASRRRRFAVCPA